MSAGYVLPSLAEVIPFRLAAYEPIPTHVDAAETLGATVSR